MDSLDRRVDLFGRHDSNGPPERSEAEQRAVVELYAYRYANGLDLWTGAPLRKEDLTNDLA